MQTVGVNKHCINYKKSKVRFCRTGNWARKVAPSAVFVVLALFSFPLWLSVMYYMSFSCFCGLFLNFAFQVLFVFLAQDRNKKGFIGYMLTFTEPVWIHVVSYSSLYFVRKCQTIIFSVMRANVNMSHDICLCHLVTVDSLVWIIIPINI